LLARSLSLEYDLRQEACCTGRKAQIGCREPPSAPTIKRNYLASFFDTSAPHWLSVSLPALALPQSNLAVATAAYSYQAKKFSIRIRFDSQAPSMCSESAK